MRQVKISVIGKVQGVFFRLYTKKQARKLGLEGWVKNEADGSVLIVAKGEDQQIEALISWCRKGSPWAQVREVNVEEQTEDIEVKGFEVR